MNEQGLRITELFSKFHFSLCAENVSALSQRNIALNKRYKS